MNSLIKELESMIRQVVCDRAALSCMAADCLCSIRVEALLAKAGFDLGQVRMLDQEEKEVFAACYVNHHYTRSYRIKKEQTLIRKYSQVAHIVLCKREAVTEDTLLYLEQEADRSGISLIYQPLSKSWLAAIGSAYTGVLFAGPDRARIEDRPWDE